MQEVYCIPDTWRSEVKGAEIVAKGKLLDYLNPEPHAPEANLNGQAVY